MRNPQPRPRLWKRRPRGYGVHQLSDSGHLDKIINPAVDAIFPNGRITAASVEELCGKLKQVALDPQPHLHTIALTAAAAIVGGGPGLIIDEAEGTPSSSAYRSRFGGLLRAYELVGFAPDRNYRYLEINRKLRALHPTIVTDTVAALERAGGTIAHNPDTDLLTVNDEFTASLVVVRCVETAAGSLRWKLRLDSALKPDMTVAVRMDPGNELARDYYLLPRLDISEATLRLCEHNGLSLDAYRFDDLSAFHRMATRRAWRYAA